MSTAIDWNKLDQRLDLEGLKNDISESAENGGGNYREVPYGTYEVKIDKMELTQSKKGDAMATVWFKILDGEFKNSIIFMNQVVKQGFQIHLFNEFLRGFDTAYEVEFNGYAKYNDLILDIFEEVSDLEIALEYGQNKKGYNTFKIIDIFE